MTGHGKWGHIPSICGHMTVYVMLSGFQMTYWYVPSMYIMIFICESMYQYVLAGDKTVFRGMMKSPSDQMLQDTFHWFRVIMIRAYLSVLRLFKKICCWSVCLYTWFVPRLYSSQYICGLYLTKLVLICTKHTSIFHQA
jgi:hypothetical protein